MKLFFIKTEKSRFKRKLRQTLLKGLKYFQATIRSCDSVSFVMRTTYRTHNSFISSNNNKTHFFLFYVKQKKNLFLNMRHDLSHFTLFLLRIFERKKKNYGKKSSWRSELTINDDRNDDNSTQKKKQREKFAVFFSESGIMNFITFNIFTKTKQFMLWTMANSNRACHFKKHEMRAKETRNATRNKKKIK